MLILHYIKDILYYESNKLFLNSYSWARSRIYSISEVKGALTSRFDKFGKIPALEDCLWLGHTQIQQFTAIKSTVIFDPFLATQPSDKWLGWKVGNLIIGFWLSFCIKCTWRLTPVVALHANCTNCTNWMQIARLKFAQTISHFAIILLTISHFAIILLKTLFCYCQHCIISSDLKLCGKMCTKSSRIMITITSQK